MSRNWFEYHKKVGYLDPVRKLFEWNYESLSLFDLQKLIRKDTLFIPPTVGTNPSGNSFQAQTIQLTSKKTFWTYLLSVKETDIRWNTLSKRATVART